MFNCATSSLLSYDALAQLCVKVATAPHAPTYCTQRIHPRTCSAHAQAAGADVPLVHYDPKEHEVPKGFFPFRDTPFYVDVSKAKSLLGFAPQNTIEEDIGWYFKNNYAASGKADFALDEEILAKK